MDKKLSGFLDIVSDFLARRKGLLPLVGILLVILNLIIQIVPGFEWLSGNNLLLHLGILVAIIGFMFAWAL
jgi:hypothetical protein